jgi:hypothetical protein
MLFAAFSAICLVIAVGYVAYAIARTGRALTEPAVVTGVGTSAEVGGASRLLYIRTDGGMWEGVARTVLPASDGPPQLLGLRCQRVHFAAGQGLCVGEDVVRGGAFLFDADGNVQHRLPANGIPSRARVSPDGRHASMTLFVKGHDYSDGAFSTETTLIDTAAGTALGNLEQFTVLRDGAPFRAADVNFWGVTFARDGNRFYATMATGGKTYLVEGDLAARQLRVMRENLECPSLSPDNTRLAFKKRMNGPGGPAVWQIHILDLATMAEHPVGETRNVDDQIEWLDDRQIMYSLRDEGPPATIRPDVWAVSVDGGAPRRLLTNALSPAVVR